jgi:FlaA1/EpsC-like NDP-sugar epimerase
MGSRGSVIPFFLERRASGILPITDPNMTRFNVTLDDGVDMVLWALENALGGEIFVPKIPSYRIIDVAEAVCPGCEKPIVGIRPGEKIHEEMITASDSYSTVDIGRYFAILSSAAGLSVGAYLQKRPGKAMLHGSSYNSETNEIFLNLEELRQLIRTYVEKPHLL